jgi:hypothetical protein
LWFADSSIRSDQGADEASYGHGTEEAQHQESNHHQAKGEMNNQVEEEVLESRWQMTGQRWKTPIIPAMGDTDMAVIVTSW